MRSTIFAKQKLLAGIELTLHRQSSNCNKGNLDRQDSNQQDLGSLDSDRDDSVSHREIISNKINPNETQNNLTGTHSPGSSQSLPKDGSLPDFRHWAQGWDDLYLRKAQLADKEISFVLKRKLSHKDALPKAIVRCESQEFKCY